MKLHVLSDLHTEFGEFEPPETDADVVILAGDIGVGTAGIDWAARQFSDQPVIYVPGNHEYYHHDIRITDELKAGAPANIHVLNQDDFEIDGVCFLGTTLWTDFRLYREGEAWFARQRAKRWIDDFTTIRNGDGRFTPELWIHGHTHVACDYEIHGTRVLCNPRGYPSECSAAEFTPGLVVEV